MTALFQRQYEAQFGRGASYANAGFEVLAVRVVGIAKLPPSGSRMKGAEPTRIGTRDVVFEDPARPVATAIYATSFPAPGSQIAGPAIIELVRQLRRYGYRPTYLPQRRDILLTEGGAGTG